MPEGENTQFDAKVIEEDGVKKLVITPKVITKKYPDGRQDVTICAPSLSLIKKFKEENGIT